MREAQYEAAMKAFPKDKAMYQKRLVELQATVGKKQEANALIAAILKDNPKDNDAIAMRAALMLTTGDRQQVNLAANDLQALVTKNPQNHLLQLQSGASFDRQGRYRRQPAMQPGRGRQDPHRFHRRARNSGAHLPGEERSRQGPQGGR